jgi:hypothetical protein
VCSEASTVMGVVVAEYCSKQLAVTQDCMIQIQDVLLHIVQTFGASCTSYLE